MSHNSNALKHSNKIFTTSFTEINLALRKPAFQSSEKDQWRIEDFPEEGALTPKGGPPTYYLPNFCRKLHENEEILGQREGGTHPLRPPLDPPLRMVVLQIGKIS